MDPNDAFSWLSGTPPTEGEAFDDAAREANAEMAAEAAELAMIPARLIYAAFSTPDGAEALQWLRERTVQVPLMDVSRSSVQGEVALSPAEWAYVRAGQNSVVELIDAQIKLALNPPEALRERAEQENGNA